MSIKFGTGGWRAIIGDDFTKSNINLIAHAITYLNRESGNKPIVVGFDNRFLSQESADWLADYFTEMGTDVHIYSESVPTPLVMHYVKKNNLDYGVMVTASHNPYNYNGIKIIVKGGLDASKEITAEIENIANGFNPAFISMPEEKGTMCLIADMYEDYEKDLFSFINVDAIKGLKLNIAFNSMNGSANNLFEDIMHKLHLQNNYVSYAPDIDPYFTSSKTNTPEPTEENITEFIEFMKFDYIRYHIGLVFDGDGDRLLVLDENRKVVDMNTLLCIYYWYLHEYRHESGAIIKNLVTTSKLERMADFYKEECINTPVGFKYITEGMNKYNALIGGESSGGFTYRGHVYGKDSILATMMLLEVLAVTKMKLSKIVELINEKFGEDYFISDKIYIPNNFDINNIDINAEVLNVSYMDGKLYTLKDGWISIRPSGTEPIVRIMVEASSKEIAEEYMSIAKKVLE